MKLTRAKIRLIEYLRSFYESEERFPTYQEACDALGIKSRSTIHFHVEELTNNGYIERHGDGAIAAVHPPQRSLGQRQVPLGGSIAASPATEAFESADVLEVPDTFVGSSADVFALEVSGPSMQDLGICDGDLVFIRRQKTARKGQVVAIRIDGETTLKTYSPKGKKLYLLPANDSMDPIVVSPNSDVEILGVLDGFYHRFS